MINSQLVNYYLDTMAWWAIHWYYMPYAVAGNSELDKFLNSVSLNGIKQSSICK